MIQRLGNVLYWLGCIIAGLCALGVGLTALLASHDRLGALAVALLYLLPIALLAFGFGWACRYVLTGR